MLKDYKWKSKYQKEIVIKHGQFQLKRTIDHIEIVLSEKCGN